MAKKSGIPWSTILTVGGIGGAAYLLLSKKAEAAPRPAPSMPGVTTAAMMPTLISGMPRNYAELIQQLDDTKTLWRAGRIATKAELNVRLSALSGYAATLRARGQINTAQFIDFAAKIASFKAQAG